MNTREQLKINELLLKLSDQTITHEEIAELEELLDKSHEAIGYFVDCMIDLKQFQDLLGQKILNRQPYSIDKEEVSGEVFDRGLWRELSLWEKTGPTVELPEEKPQRESIRRVIYPELEKRPVSRLSITVGILSAAAILFLMLFVRFAPPKTGIEVATLSDSMNAVWADVGDGTIKSGYRFATGSDVYFLRKGYAKLLFDNDAQITIEAPAEFQVLTHDQIKLDYGELYAVVPDKAYGFTVSTANSKIIDLGTEFGIKGDSYGNAELHVIKGRVNLVSRLGGKNINLEVLGNVAKRLNAQTGQLTDIPVSSELFTRNINSRFGIVWKGQTSIDLADIVGGGNGFGTGKLGSGIDPSSGEMSSKKMIGTHSSSGQYIPVKASSFIDGIFIPDGENGPVVISSDDHLFEGCRDTNGKYWGGIFDGAQHETLQHDIPRHSLRLGSDTYYGEDNSSIYMHANQGITFDLVEIRRMIPEQSISHFTAACGISNTLEDYKDQLRSFDFRNSKWANITPESSKADFYVLVDGQVRFSKVDMSVQDGTVDLSVDILPEDRFLTLVTTQGSDTWGNTDDWTLFGDPKLIIK